jgi:predicted TIM-barrel fold metal-dependent hydrolase
MDRRAFLAGGAALTLAGPLAAQRPRPAAEPLFDAHIHFFTSDIAHYPIDPRGAREPEEVLRARILHAPATPGTVFALWDQAGVEGGTGVQYSGAYKADNSYVLDIADRHRARIATEIIVNARDPASVAQVERTVRTRRVNALRLTGLADADGHYPWLDGEGALRVWALAERLRLPVGVTYLPPRVTGEAFAAIARLATRFPGCTILFEHMGWTGGPNSPGLLAEHRTLVAHRNVHFKWTTLDIDALRAAGIDEARVLRDAVALYGPRRIMWGSDFGNTTRPYGGMARDARDSCALLNSTARRAVLHDNAVAIFRGG